MTQIQITRERIDELLRFLPKLEKPSEDTKAIWPEEMKRDAERGVLAMSYPAYPNEVEDFYELAAKPCWNDGGYDPAEVRPMVQSDDFIATASLDQIKTLLTFCVRGERFCSGHWAMMIEEGRIGAILRRLQQLRESVE